jgi:hypothetical protein
MRGWLIVAIAVAVMVPAAAIAGDLFTDVPDSNIFHDDIGWLADNGVTLGCNPPANDKFCPGDNVTREQMAAFLRRLAENEVVDAGTVEGKSASDLESHAYEVREVGFVSVPANATTSVLTLNLPAGSYLIQARAGIDSNMAGASAFDDIACALTAGATETNVLNLFLGANLDPGKTEWASWMFTHTFNADGTAVLSCDASSAWNGDVIAPAITAISVQGVTASVFSQDD